MKTESSSRHLFVAMILGSILAPTVAIILHFVLVPSSATELFGVICYAEEMRRAPR